MTRAGVGAILALGAILAAPGPAPGGVAAAASDAQAEKEGRDDEAFLEGLLDLELDRAVELLLERSSASNSPIDPREARVALARLRTRRAETAAGREAAVEALLAAERARMEGDAPATRLVEWQTTLAEDLVEAGAWATGAAARMLVGVPDPETRDRARRRAAEALERTNAAEALLPDALRDLEREIEAGDEAARVARRELAETVRNARLPLARARARAVLAEADDPAGWRLVRDDALRAADGLAGAALDASRLLAGLALARLGERDAAREQLSRVADEARAEPLARLVARIALAETEGPDAAVATAAALAADADAPVFDRVLAVEAVVRIEAAVSQAAAGTERVRRLEALVARLDRIVESAGGADGAILRRGARSALAVALPIPAEDATLPLEIVVAHAEAALARTPPDADRAIALLAPRVAGGAVADPGALRLFGAALAAADRPRDAAAQFLAAAQRSGRARAAVALADRAAGSAWIAVQAGDDEAAATLEAAIDLRVELAPDDDLSDRWRTVAARRALAHRDFARALALAEGVRVGSPSAGDAAWIAVSALRARRAVGDDAAPSAAAMLQRVRSAQDVVSGWSVSDRAEDRAWYAAMLGVVEAETLLAAEGPAAAMARLDVLDDDELPVVVRTEALRVRIAALREAGRLHEASDAVARLVARAPEAAVPAVSALVREMLDRVAVRRDDGRSDEARAIAADELAPLTRMLETALDAAAPDAGDPAWRDFAASLLALERWSDAAATYDRLLVREPDAADLLLGRAEALFGGGGNDADAMRLYQRLASADPGRFPREHWTAQLRMLEILLRNQRDIERIAPRVRRLREIDPEMGGPALRRAFERVEREAERRPAGG